MPPPAHYIVLVRGPGEASAGPFAEATLQEMAYP